MLYTFAMLLPLSSRLVAFVRYFGIIWIMTCKHLSALCDRKKWAITSVSILYINSILILFWNPCFIFLLFLLLLFERTWCGEMKHLSLAQVENNGCVWIPRNLLMVSCTWSGSSGFCFTSGGTWVFFVLFFFFKHTINFAF